jgi:hypothetical protein
VTLNVGRLIAHEMADMVHAAGHPGRPVEVDDPAH